jgi:gliding motility-associated-like protein
VVSPSTTSFTPFTYTLDNTTIQASSTFNNLSAGAHQLHLEDARGCSSDTTFFVPQTISAQANFQTTPLVGFTPHDIYLLNTSTNASDYLWQIDGANQGNDLTHYTFNDQGTFEITLIAWKYDPSCSDTISKIAYVKPQLIIPTAFTPDNDLINDTWEIEHLDEMYPENIVQIYNRWGELLFESQAGNYNSNPWNGTYNNKPLPIGSYYFIIQTNEEEAGIVQGTVSLVFSY